MGSYQLLADTLMTNFLVVKELRYVLKRYFSNYFPFLFAVDVERDGEIACLINDQCINDPDFEFKKKKEDCSEEVCMHVYMERTKKLN
jgi:hypothetical protein